MIASYSNPHPKPSLLAHCPLAPSFLAASFPFPDFDFLDPDLLNPGTFLPPPPEVKVAVEIADVTDEVPFTVRHDISMCPHIHIKLYYTSSSHTRRANIRPN